MSELSSPQNILQEKIYAYRISQTRPDTTQIHRRPGLGLGVDCSWLSFSILGAHGHFFLSWNIDGDHCDRHWALVRRTCESFFSPPHVVKTSQPATVHDTLLPPFLSTIIHLPPHQASAWVFELQILNITRHFLVVMVTLWNCAFLW